MQMTITFVLNSIKKSETNSFNGKGCEPVLDANNMANDNEMNNKTRTHK